ncbi:IclR family transcriptional regulator [Leucobacter sp. wl10]|uniref:IclR family transcriptional regulator n=1 Tax=Leucobacter sp. wl10 TaxID=2304677 RepID=UPI000E5A6A5F|nr:IclR family transcriptional regulator [Leucobacter sp. wl10]RGE19289.1 IclR family transcriptional regulator [Leucobacter sp. wl10]
MSEGVLGGTDGSSPQGVLERALGVLGCFTEDEPELTAAEIGLRTDLAPSTLHRLLGTLLRHGLLVRVPDRRYAVGPRLWEFGELSPLALRLRERTIPHLMRLYEATGENVHLGVLDGGPEGATVLYVGRVSGRRSIPTVSRSGGRGPLHATGVGKALLASRDEEWLARFFARPLERETVHTIVDEAELREELRLTLARGYALTREEMTLGNISVAAALPSVPGLPPIALGLVVHIDRFDERLLARLVHQSAREIFAEVREP